MNERIKAHLDFLMQDAPKTRRVEEMKEELLAGCLDKYEDLTANGMDPETAYRKVIDGIGDVKELLDHIERTSAFDPVGAEEKRKKRAFFTSIGICFYFIAIAVIIFYSFLGVPAIGAALMVLCLGIGSVLLIYGRMTTIIRYEKTDDTIVEELKEQMTYGKKGSKMAGLAFSSLWCIVVVLYFLISFVSGAWHVSWIIFVIGAGIQSLMSGWFFPQSKSKSYIGAFWCLIVTLYILISFQASAWHISWIIFPLAAAVQQALRFYMAWREEA